MKKITALLLCFLLLCMLPVAAFATDPDDEVTDTEISLAVPDSHKITIVAEEAQVFLDGVSGAEFTVERLSEPRLLIRAESGKVIQSVTLNGEDVTDLLYGGYLQLSPVYEDKEIVVTTEDEDTEFEDRYIVKGKATLNDAPLADVDLELRSTLKTTKTDENGKFVFTDVEPGKHSLTALKDGKVIGYLCFALEADVQVDVSLLDDGTYTVSIDKNSAGVELHLILNEDDGTLDPVDVEPVQKADPDTPQTGDNTNLTLWWILLLVSATGIVVLETYRRKKKVE